jgi:hypothetical protein
MGEKSGNLATPTFPSYIGPVQLSQTRGKMSTPLPGLRRATGYQRSARAHARCGNTRLYELLAAREVEGDVDGRSRKITVHSTRRYLARGLATWAGE